MPHRVSPHFGIRAERYKLIRFYGPRDAWELYDLRQDPDEMKNLYGQKETKNIVASLKVELAALALQYEDKEALKIINSGF